MDITGNRKREWGLTAVLHASFIVSVAVNSILQKENTQIVLSNLVLSVVLAIVFSVYLNMVRERVSGIKPYRLIPAALYITAFFAALVLVGISERYPVGVFWLLPVVLAAMASGMELAFATHIALMMEYLILVMPQGQHVYAFISYLLLGIVAALLFAALKEKKTLLYLAIILFACDGVLLFVIYQFDLTEIGKNIIPVAIELASIALLIVVGAIFLWRVKPLSDSEDGEELSAEEALSKLLQVSEKLANRESGQPVSLNAEEAKWEERMVVVEVVNDQESKDKPTEERTSHDSAEEESREWIERERKREEDTEEAQEPELTGDFAEEEAELEEEVQESELSGLFAGTESEQEESEEETEEVAEEAEEMQEPELSGLFVEAEFVETETETEPEETEEAEGIEEPELTGDFTETETEPEETGDEAGEMQGSEPTGLFAEAEFVETKAEPEELEEETEGIEEPELTEKFAETETELEETGDEAGEMQEPKSTGLFAEAEFVETEAEPEETEEAEGMEEPELTGDFTETETEPEETGDEAGEMQGSESSGLFAEAEFVETETEAEPEKSEEGTEGIEEPGLTEKFAETETEPEETEEETEEMQESEPTELFAETETEPEEIHEPEMSEMFAETETDSEEIHEPEPAEDAVQAEMEIQEELEESADASTQAKEELPEEEADASTQAKGELPEEEADASTQVQREEDLEEAYDKALENMEMDVNSSLSEVLEDDFPLHELLAEYSDELYKHSCCISNLSAAAAEVIGADVSLAKAGGLYHEIGRITNEGNYIEEGASLAEEYGFPEKLSEVMRQHSISHEMPESPEAAIVMLSDCIINTAELLEQSGRRDTITDARLVNKVFKNRLASGNLKNSGLTAEQLIALKDFYTNNAFAEE